MSEFFKNKGESTELGLLLFSVPCHTRSHDQQHTWALDLDFTVGLNV